MRTSKQTNNRAHGMRARIVNDLCFFRNIERSTHKFNFVLLKLILDTEAENLAFRLC